MEKLLASRTNRDQQLITVGNLSPEKYGKSAFCNLQYTPSRLADNVLFKQVTTLKKVQEEVSKNREFQAINDCLMDKLRYIEEQKTVIIDSLNQQIIVYKKIIKQMQSKNEQRIRQLQRKFKQQLSRIIQSKQQQVRFVQSQKQILENRISQLQVQNKNLLDQIANHQKSVYDIKSGGQRLQKQVQNLNYKIKEKVQIIKELQEKNRLQQQENRMTILDIETLWQQKLKDALNRKQIEIQALTKTHQFQYQKLQQLLALQSQSHKHQTSDIIHSYQKQLKKLSEIIVTKQRSLDIITKDHRQQKSRNLSLNKTYQSELTQLNNVKLLTSALQSQNDKLRDLLIESSKQLQRCRQQFLTLDRQNHGLKLKLKGVEQEARTWRESYYGRRA